MMMSSNSSKSSSNSTVAAPTHYQAQQAEQQVVAGERKTRPQLDRALICPRCDSSNTKFCYYNNNKMSQPRYFCKTCRRYWTQGGTLRYVPIGGGSRKNKQRSNSTSSSDDSIINKQLRKEPVPASSTEEHDLPNVLSTFMSASSKGNDFCETMISGMVMETPFSFGFDVVMQHGSGAAPIDGGGASAAAHQGGQRPTKQVGAAKQQEGASVPDTTKDIAAE